MHIEFEPYEFQNIYLITTYRCNWQCEFCLFRFNKEPEASTDEILGRLEYSIKDSRRQVYIKITGGEPFIKQDLLREVFGVASRYKERVYKIGIGTNGSISLQPFFNDVDVRTHIFLSRHEVMDELLRPNELAQGVHNPLIDFRINCNLIEGGVDNLKKIECFIDEKYGEYGITHYCFRELSKVDVDANAMYPKQIYEYIEYYHDHLVPVKAIEERIQGHPGFRKSRITGNYYDRNDWYWYDHDGQQISVKFRAIDETRLIDFNTNVKPDDVDEYVIHPDGTLTGCWDKELKVIMRGGEKNA